MRYLSFRPPAHWAQDSRPPRPRRVALAPMLPALLRGVAFFFAFATPFVAALLIR